MVLWGHLKICCGYGEGVIMSDQVRHLIAKFRHGEKSLENDRRPGSQTGI